MPAPYPDPFSPSGKKSEPTDSSSAALHGWSVSNFKAFAEQPQHVPLAPITLIFGPNSGGKSSLMHSFLLAHDLIATGSPDVHEPTLAEGSIDLGGFAQFIHCQKVDERAISLEFSARPDALNQLFKDRSGGILPTKAESVSVTLVLAKIPEHAANDSLHGQPTLTRLDVALDKKFVCRLSRTREGEMFFTSVDLAHRFFIRLGADYAQLVRSSSANPDKAGARIMRMMEETVPQTKILFDSRAGILPVAAELQPTVVDGPPDHDEGYTDPDGLVDEEHKQDYLEEGFEEAEHRFAEDELRRSDPDFEAITTLSLRFAELLGDFVRCACAPLKDNLSKLTYLGPLRSFPERDFTLTHARDSHWHAGGGFAWDVMARDAEVRAAVNKWFNSDFIKTPYQFVVTDLVSGEIVSSAIESEFADIVQEKSREHEIRRGSDDEKEKERFYFPYDTWDTDELGKRISGMAIERAKASRRTELRLIDKRTGARVSHRDVGVGLSQILPILVRAFSEVEKIHLIEQPEIHVHPALQAELGDVFINSALGEGQNRFLIETHSEHLILRILKRIRQTTERETEPGHLPIRLEDVSVIYAEPTKEGTKLHQLRITPDGDFADRWPDGFFTERGKELFT